VEPSSPEMSSSAEREMAELMELIMSRFNRSHRPSVKVLNATAIETWYEKSRRWLNLMSTSIHTAVLPGLASGRAGRWYAEVVEPAAMDVQKATECITVLVQYNGAV